MNDKDQPIGRIAAHTLRAGAQSVRCARDANGDVWFDFTDGEAVIVRHPADELMSLLSELRLEPADVPTFGPRPWSAVHRPDDPTPTNGGEHA